MRQPVSEGTEIHFLPAISGGSINLVKKEEALKAFL
jgi:hypothetical protein